MKFKLVLLAIATVVIAVVERGYALPVIEQQLSVPWPSSPDLNQQSVIFRVRLLRLNLQNPRLQMRPRWANPNQVTGTAPLPQIGAVYGAIAGINGGFFHIQRQMPLGAIKTEQQWYSGPILGRGAIAWNDQGEVLIDRLVYGERLTVDQSLIFLQALNSGYVKAGIARYNSNWGDFYTPITSSELIFVVRGDRLVDQITSPGVGRPLVPIPQDGYLLVARQADPADLTKLQLQAQVILDTRTLPDQFGRFPQVLGGGPLLLKQGQVVLDLKQEGFSAGFANTRAARSAIATTSQPGELLLVNIDNHDNLELPNLEQTAKILQRLGAVDALNLDGGGSTGMFSPQGTSKGKRPVHNGLLIFVTQ